MQRHPVQWCSNSVKTVKQTCPAQCTSKRTQADSTPCTIDGGMIDHDKQGTNTAKTEIPAESYAPHQTGTPDCALAYATAKLA